MTYERLVLALKGSWWSLARIQGGSPYIVDHRAINVDAEASRMCHLLASTCMGFQDRAFYCCLIGHGKKNIHLLIALFIDRSLTLPLNGSCECVHHTMSCNVISTKNMKD